MAKLIQVIEVEEQERVVFGQFEPALERPMNGARGAAAWTRVQPIKRYYTAAGELLFTVDPSTVAMPRAELDAMVQRQNEQATDFANLYKDHDKLGVDLREERRKREDLKKFATLAYGFLQSRARGGSGPWRVREAAAKILKGFSHLYRAGIQ